MKLVSRFAVAFFSGTCLCLLVTSWLAAARESERAAARIERDTRALGETLRAAVTLSWAAGGEDTARRLAESPDVERENVEVTWSPGVPTLEGAVLDHPSGTSPLRLRVPVRIPGGTGGTLVLLHAVPSQGELLRAALAEELAALLALGLVTGALAALLGTVLIGRPLERVVSQARRVARGDLSVRLSERRTDEIGDLKRELNVMCDCLADAGRKLEEESAKRVETLEQLRHLDRLRTVGTLSSAVAHELGTPLNVVLLRAQTLVDEPGPAEDRADAARVIVAQVERMSRIVRQLLDFSRAEGRHVREVSLRAVLDDAAALLGSLAKKHGVALVVVPGEEVTLAVDPGQIEQAVTNLIVNGVHAMPEGGQLKVSLRVVEAQRPGTLAAPVRVVRIDVRDQGVGITEVTLARIFEPFYTTKEDGRGTGLGLSVAGGIAEEHGGWLHAESELGHGSTFSIYLPLKPE